MTRQDWKSLKQDAQDFIDNVNLADMPDIEYCMLGASVAILDHKVEEVADQMLRYIECELKAAEDYLMRHMENKDRDYLQMSFDRVSHGLKFIRELPEGEEKHQYMADHDEIVAAIKRYGMAI